MVCLRNVSVDTLHKGDTEDDDDNDDDDDDDNNNNNNNNNGTGKATLCFQNIWNNKIRGLRLRNSKLRYCLQVTATLKTKRKINLETYKIALTKDS
jgi:hypothetical protein